VRARSTKGYGFVSFRTREEADLAMQQMNGQFVGHRRVRCGWAQHKQDAAHTMDFNAVDRVRPLP
jgi:nucleolysin TIA-1/TIAR